ncbi:MAG: hypothetical protein GX139_05790 [Armatimonadetes bacterium]|jgi:hypothetical protein|nr:hypothetical protein [Armatimonadota bacterium]
MGTLEVIFLEVPQIGRPVSILCGSEKKATSVVKWTQQHPTNKNLYRVAVANGQMFVGEYNPYALANTQSVQNQMPSPASAPVYGYTLPGGCLARAAGVNGQIELYEDYLILKRKGVISFIAHGFKGEKEIYLDQISAVQLKQCGTLTSGYLQIVFKGSQESKSALFDAVSDENTVIFGPDRESEFLHLKMLLDKQRRQSRLGPPASASTSVADEIDKLDSLRRRGIITDREFEAKKRELLGL